MFATVRHLHRRAMGAADSPPRDGWPQKRRGASGNGCVRCATSFDAVGATGTGVQPSKHFDGFDARPETLGRPGETASRSPRARGTHLMALRSEVSRATGTASRVRIAVLAALALASIA